MTGRSANTATIKYEMPASAAQQYIVRHAGEKPAAWNVAVRFRLTGPLEITHLQEAINRVVDQHEILRTCFSQSGSEVRQSIADSCIVPLAFFDGSAPGLDSEQEVDRISRQEARRIFDLNAPPLLHAALIRTAPDDHILLLTAHHAVCDGWSVGILAAGIMRAYADVCAGVPFQRDESELQYADYAVAHQEYAATPEYRAHAEFWKREVASLARTVDAAGPQISGTGLDAEIHSRLLPLDLTRPLEALARSEDLTFFEVVLSAFALSRMRATHQQHATLATPVSGRNSPETEAMMGSFVNYLPVRMAGQPGVSLKAFRHAASESIHELQSHADYRTEDLLAEHAGSLAPVFEHVFICQRDFVPTVEGGGVRLTPIPSVSPGALHAMTFFLVERADGWRASCEIDCSVYSSGDAEAAIDSFEQVLRIFVEQPDASVASVLGILDNQSADVAPSTVVDFPASEAQQRYWMLEQVQPEKGTLHLRIRLRIRGDFDPNIARRALQLLVDRHQALRTTLFMQGDDLRQRVHPPGTKLNFEVQDLRSHTLDLDDVSLAAGLLRNNTATFNQEQQSWLHAVVILLGDTDAILALTLSHAIADGWSCGILLREFYSAYHSLSHNELPQFEPLHLQYSDATLHEKQWLESNAMAERLSWWQKTLPAKLPSMALPADREYPGPSESGIAVFALDPMLAATVRQFAQDNGVTLFSIYGAALLGLVARYTGQQALSLVTPFANRTAETERVIGPFATPVLVHTSVPQGASFHELLDRFQHQAMASFENALPLERCVEFTSLQSRFGRHAANQISFFYQAAFVSSTKTEAFVATPMPAAPAGAAFEWQFAVIDYGTQLRIEFQYDANLWSAASIQLCAEHYERFLRESIFHPDKAIATIEIATEQERSIANTSDVLLPISRRALTAGIQATATPPIPVAAPYAAPRTDLERTITSIWQNVFRSETIGIHDDFFDLGGHSLLLARMQTQLKNATGHRIVAADIFAAPTIAQLAEHLQSTKDRPRQTRIFPLHSAGNQPPLFLISQSMVFRRMVQWLHPDQPVYTVLIQDEDLRNRPRATFEEIAAYYASLIRAARPNGPYRIGGWCVSSWLAYEVARQLRVAGEQVDLLLLVDGWAPAYWRSMGPIKHLAAKSNYYFARALLHARTLAGASASERLAFFTGKLDLLRTATSRRIATLLYSMGIKVEVRIEEQLTLVDQIIYAASRRYTPPPHDFPSLLFRSAEQPQGTLLPLDLGWSQLLRRHIDAITLPGDHQGIFEDPGAQILAQTISDFLHLPSVEPNAALASDPLHTQQSAAITQQKKPACTLVQT
jgi:thioesterase domain-containing protein/non-ribosomal peptide synthetase component F